METKSLTSVSVFGAQLVLRRTTHVQIDHFSGRCSSRITLMAQQVAQVSILPRLPCTSASNLYATSTDFWLGSLVSWLVRRIPVLGTDGRACLTPTNPITQHQRRHLDIWLLKALHSRHRCRIISHGDSRHSLSSLTNSSVLMAAQHNATLSQELANAPVTAPLFPHPQHDTLVLGDMSLTCSNVLAQ